MLICQLVYVQFDSNLRQVQTLSDDIQSQMFFLGASSTSQQVTGCFRINVQKYFGIALAVESYEVSTSFTDIGTFLSNRTNDLYIRFTTVFKSLNTLGIRQGLHQTPRAQVGGDTIFLHESSSWGEIRLHTEFGQVWLCRS